MIYLLEVKLLDGRRLHPVTVRRDALDWEEQLDQAVACLEAQYAGQGVVEVLYGKDLYAMGASEPEAIPDWPTYRSAL